MMEQSAQPVLNSANPSSPHRSLVLLHRENQVTTQRELERLVSSVDAAGWCGHLVLTRRGADLVDLCRGALDEHRSELVVAVEIQRPEELTHLIPLLKNALTEYRERPLQFPTEQNVEHLFVTVVDHQTGPLQKLVSWFYHLLLRLLFRAHQSSFRTGFAIIPKDSLLIREMTREPFTSDRNADLASDKHPVRRISELIKICRLKQIPIRESVHYLPQAHALRLADDKKKSEAPQGFIFRSIGCLKPWVIESGQDLRFWWNRVAFPGDTTAQTQVKDGTSGWTQNRWLATMVLMIASSFLLFNNLNFPLFEPDETRNSQIALNVLDSGDWVSLTLNDEPYWNKPPALIWAIAISYKTFGFSPWATRLPGAIASLMTIIAVLELGRKLVGFRAAFIAATALLLSCGFALISRWVIMDASFTFFVTMTSLCLILAHRTHWRIGRPSQVQGNRFFNKQNRWLILAGLCGGAAMMLKGPVVMILVAPPVVLAYTFAGEFKFMWRRLAYFLIPFLLVAVPWYLTISFAQPGFIENYFWRQNLVRFSDAFDHQAPWWFYGPITFAMTFPACYLFPWLVRFLISSDESIRSARTPAIGFFLMMAVWVIFFFSLSESKLPTYILPAVPFSCLMFGALLDYQLSIAKAADSVRTAKQKPSWFSFEQLPLMSAFGFVVVALVLVFVLNVFWNSGLPISILGISLVTGICLALCFVSSRSRFPTVHWGVFGVNGLMMMATVAHFLIPHFADLRSTHRAIAELRRQPDFQSAPIVFLDRHSYSVSTVVSEEQVFRFQANQKELFQKFVTKNPRSIIIAPAQMLAEYCEPLESQIDLEKNVLGKKYVHRCSPKTSSDVASEKSLEPQHYSP